MTERDNVSMATVQMKPDYAASEVYSTASEAPPAYKRQSSSVKIAKIAAFTIVVSSFILGSFILASSYLQAKASCDQVQALDSVLEKELMLETLQQVNKDIPRAEALLGKENNDDIDLQNLDKDETVKKIEPKQEKDIVTSDGTENSEKDNSYSESEETEEAKWPNKVPLELDLSDLATAILQNTKRSRMNCVVERKHAEEFVDSPSKTVSLPFGMNLTTDPKKARITGERISIYCEGGNENSKEQETQKHREEENDDTEEDFEPIRAVYLPYQRLPIPFGQIPQQFPLTHMPQRMMPPQAAAAMQQAPPPQQAMIRQMPPPFQQLPMRPPMPPQVMQAPHPEPQSMHRMQELQQPQTVRIHVQQIPFREIHVADDVPVQIPSQQQELPHFQIQRMPLVVALQRAGITADDLRNIKRMAEDRITDELRRLAAEEAAESAENTSNSSEEDNSDSQGSAQNSGEREQSSPAQAVAAAAAAAAAGAGASESSSSASSSAQEQQSQQSQQPRMMEQQIPIQVQRLILQTLPEQPRDTMTPPMPDQPQSPQMMQYGRAVYGRSLAQPVRIPVPMMPMVPQHMSAAEDSTAAASAPISPESERPHFVQPRSV